MAELTGVKPGDKIIVSSYRAGREGRSILTVDKVTKLYVFCGTSRYRVDSGRLVGASTWDTDTASKPTPKLLAEVRAENARKRLVRNVDMAWHKFKLKEASDETLNALLELLTPKE